MNRRDMLRNTGAAVLTGAALSLSSCCSSRKSLAVTFVGPFCFEKHKGNDGVIVNAAPVGPDFTPCMQDIRHQPWIGTSSNETRLTKDQTYRIKGLKAGRGEIKGTDIDCYPYTYNNSGEEENGLPPLFTVILPVPDVLVGSHPTTICYQEGPCDDSLGRELATRLTFLYEHVCLPDVKICVKDSCKDIGEAPFFTPGFEIDANLPLATLGIYLSPFMIPDNGHEHSKVVFQQMIGMYPYLPINSIQWPPPAPKFFALDERGIPTQQSEGSGDDCKPAQLLISMQ